MAASRRNSPPSRRIDSGENGLKSSHARSRPQLALTCPSLYSADHGERAVFFTMTLFACDGETGPDSEISRRTTPLLFLFEVDHFRRSEGLLVADHLTFELGPIA